MAMFLSARLGFLRRSLAAPPRGASLGSDLRQASDESPSPSLLHCQLLPRCFTSNGFGSHMEWAVSYSCLSRYAAEATVEHVGRSARKMGLRSVVMKVKGASFFKKKKVILNWREGFRGETVRDQSPIMYIHDVTQLPHNGCRLPKQRWV
ncbi:hypothetical protein C2845_PM05G28940 [Panicum miliaceum]|uniref:Uncharacterized protein n=1 Tax=Panicum miliaceum TaxID=4540 RepID=A0A3L6SWP4_PANMI|nr:hypothetical protein C2845_PM05G28940 [Panicum miliaceum]